VYFTAVELPAGTTSQFPLAAWVVIFATTSNRFSAFVSLLSTSKVFGVLKATFPSSSFATGLLAVPTSTYTMAVSQLSEAQTSY